MSLHLYACGFNAFGQLSGQQVEDDPRDLPTFQLIVSGHTVRLLFAGWSDTLFEVDGRLVLWGASNSCPNTEVTCAVDASKFVSTFGDHTGLKGSLTDDGRLMLLVATDDGSLSFEEHSVSGLSRDSLSGPTKVHHLAVAGNGRVCVSLGTVDLLEFITLVSFLEHANSSSSSSSPIVHHLAAPATTLLASETSFTAIVRSHGLVYTFGDGRHNHLGRPLSAEAPSHVAHLVDDLGGIPMDKLVTGGWVTAGISESKELFLWGGRPGESHRISALPSGNAEVIAVEIDEMKPADVVDVGVGSGHIVVLSDDGRMYAAGKGKNGQLGAGERDFEEQWIATGVGLDTNCKVTAVFCGPCTSFALVSNIPNQESSELQSG